MKFGTIILAYNQEDYIKYCLDSIYNYMDSIVILYSTVPWIQYNSKAREQFTTVDSTLKIVNNFPDPNNKLFLKEGVWDSDEDMRNEGIRILESHNIDWVHIIDADEFYPDEQIVHLQNYIKQNYKEINGSVLWSRRLNHFKRFDYIIDPEEDNGDPIEIAFPLNNGIYFKDRRLVNAPQYLLPKDFFFHHFGFVLTDARMWEKINTWGHAHEMLDYWFQAKWLNWSPTSRDLCKRVEGRWNKCIPFDLDKIPTVLKNHPFYKDAKENTINISSPRR